MPVQRSQSAEARIEEEKPTVDIKDNLPFLPSGIIAPTKDKKKITDKHLVKWSNFFWVFDYNRKYQQQNNYDFLIN